MHVLVRVGVGEADEVGAGSNGVVELVAPPPDVPPEVPLGAVLGEALVDFAGSGDGVVVAAGFAAAVFFFAAVVPTAVGGPGFTGGR